MTVGKEAFYGQLAIPRSIPLILRMISAEAAMMGRQTDQVCSMSFGWTIGYRRITCFAASMCLSAMYWAAWQLFEGVCGLHDSRLGQGRRGVDASVMEANASRYHGKAPGEIV
jgi:hypothetical protein